VVGNKTFSKIHVHARCFVQYYTVHCAMKALMKALFMLYNICITEHCICISMMYIYAPALGITAPIAFIVWLQAWLEVLRTILDPRNRK
jgi:hypothetical protein